MLSGGKYQKQIKELQSRLEELDEELSIERTARSKAEKSRAILKKDLEDLGSRLEEAGANTTTQVQHIYLISRIKQYRET